MKSAIMSALLAATALLGGGPAAPVAASQELPERYFAYPVPPESLATLAERTNFLLEHFWEKCPWKSAFSSVSRLQGAFNDYASFMPYADAQVVHQSIDALIKQVEKKPEQLLALAEMAQGAFYSDTASVACDECYLPFARAVADNKKIEKGVRERYAYQARTLEGSQVGMEAPDFAMTAPGGAVTRLSDQPRGAYVLLFFNDPECDECQMARVRLSADNNLNELLDRGLIKVLSVLPSEPTEQWLLEAPGWNPRWTVGYSEEVDQAYDMRTPPVIYYLNGDHKILSKSFDIDNLLLAFRVVNEKMKAGHRQAAEAAAAAAHAAAPAPEEQAQ